MADTAKAAEDAAKAAADDAVAAAARAAAASAAADAAKAAAEDVSKVSLAADAEKAVADTAKAAEDAATKAADEAVAAAARAAAARAAASEAARVAEDVSKVSLAADAEKAVADTAKAAEDAAKAAADDAVAAAARAAAASAAADAAKAAAEDVSKVSLAADAEKAVADTAKAAEDAATKAADEAVAAAARAAAARAAASEAARVAEDVSKVALAADAEKAVADTAKVAADAAKAEATRMAEELAAEALRARNATVSKLSKALKSISKSIKSSSKIGARLANTGKNVLIGRTTTAELLSKFKSFSALEKAALGMRWMKETYKLNIDAARALLEEAAARGATATVSSIMADAATRAAAVGAKAGEMAVGLATDPMMIAMMAGMALDMTNTGGLAVVEQTSDYLQIKTTEDATTANMIIDCDSWPRGPRCPPSPAPSPPPGSPTPPPSPAPPPAQGRYPKFMGPLDLIDNDTLYNIALSNVYQNFSDPGFSNGPLNLTIKLLETYTDPTITGVATNLRNLYKTICTDPATTMINLPVTDPTCAAMYEYPADAQPCNYPIDSSTSMLWWSNTASQSVITNAITALTITSVDRTLIARLKVLNSIQKAIANYVIYIITNGDDPGQLFVEGQLAIDGGTMPDSILNDLFDAENDNICIYNGGTIINPGPGYSPHTCTWATEADCHGAFPWVPSDSTPTTNRLLCMTTSPAPCPASPAGSPSPAVCPPPIPYVATAPCPATTDPNGANLTYTEWRKKDWFSAPGSTWSTTLDQTQIPAGGACIQAGAGLHILCDTNNTSVIGAAKNDYTRNTGVCENSKSYCDIKGISYGDVTLSDMGNYSDGDAIRLGAHNSTSSIAHSGSASDVFTEGQLVTYRQGPALKSCFVNPGQEIAEILFSSTFTRFLFSERGWSIIYGTLANLDKYYTPIGGFNLANPPPIQPIHLSQPPPIASVYVAPPPNINAITITPPPAVNVGGGAVGGVVNTVLNGTVGAGLTAATTVANGGIYVGNSIASVGATAVTSVGNFGVTAGNSIQHAGVVAGNSIANTGIKAVNAAEKGSVKAVNTIANAGISAANIVTRGSIALIEMLVSSDYEGALTKFANDLSTSPLATGGASMAGINVSNGSPPAQGAPPPACFPGNANAVLEDGTIVSMADIRNGMKVLSASRTGKPIFSEVFMWLIRDPDLVGAFVQLKTDSGKTIRLSGQHYIHVTRGTWNDTVLLSAQEVRIGDLLWVDFKPSQVTEINTITEKGVFSPVTLEGTIVVDSVLASVSTTYEDILSGFPTLYFGKRVPPMMVHHFIMKWIYLLGGKMGLNIMNFVHRPLYYMAGYKPPVNF